MNAININPVDVQRVYAEADQGGKSALSKLFDTSILQQSITDRVKSYEDACKAKGLNSELLPDNSMLPPGMAKALTAYAKLFIIAEAINEGWTPDYSDTDLPKYFPYFEVEATEEQKGGIGFSFYGYDYGYALSNTGSRLCFPDRDKALYFGETFADLFKDAYLIS